MSALDGHTPAPLSIEGPTKGFPGYIIHGGPTWAEVATLAHNGETNAEADANLMALAPFAPHRCQDQACPGFRLWRLLDQITVACSGSRYQDLAREAAFLLEAAGPAITEEPV